jgi:hypothetical protein
MRQPDQAAVCWRDAAVALRDAGNREEAARLEKLAAVGRMIAAYRRSDGAATCSRSPG